MCCGFTFGQLLCVENVLFFFAFRLMTCLMILNSFWLHVFSKQTKYCARFALWGQIHTDIFRRRFFWRWHYQPRCRDSSIWLNQRVSERERENQQMKSFSVLVCVCVRACVSSLRHTVWLFVATSNAMISTFAFYVKIRQIYRMKVNNIGIN